MTVSISIHHIKNAVGRTYEKQDFDCVEVFTEDGFNVPMFLPLGTGQAVADAINAAIKPKEAE